MTTSIYSGNDLFSCFCLMLMDDAKENEQLCWRAVAKYLKVLLLREKIIEKHKILVLLPSQGNL